MRRRNQHEIDNSFTGVKYLSQLARTTCSFQALLAGSKKLPEPSINGANCQDHTPNLITDAYKPKRENNCH